MIPVQSSKIKAVGYDHANKNMYTEFMNGDVFVYFRITPEQYKELMNAKSIGVHHGVMMKGKTRPHDFSRMTNIGGRWAMEK